MTVSDIIAEVTQAGGDIRADGDYLELEAPQPLPPDLLARIREHKAVIMAALESRSAESPPPDSDEEKIHAEEIKALSNAFYNHLWGTGKATGCCYAPADRYCPEGQKLKDAYYRKCN